MKSALGRIGGYLIRVSYTSLTDKQAMSVAKTWTAWYKVLSIFMLRKPKERSI